MAEGPAGWAQAREVLCVRLDSMGDVLMTSPALRAVRAGGRRITLVTSRSGAAAAELVPEVDEVIVYDAPWVKATAPRSDPAPDHALVGRLSRGGFDGAIVFTVYSQNPLPAALMCHLAGIPLRLAHCRENPYGLLSDWVREPEPHDLARHEVQRQLDLVATVGLTTQDHGLSLRVPGPARAAVEEILAEAPFDPAGPWAVIHPGASAPSRRYPPEGYAAAARLLHGLGWGLVYTGGPGESELVDAATEGVASLSLAGRLSLAELAALLERAPVLVANNSGPVHVASAVGTPVVDLYALTNPQHTPWGVPHRVLYHDVECRWCYSSVCRTGHHHCLRLVTPEAIADAARALVDAPRSPGPAERFAADALAARGRAPS